MLAFSRILGVKVHDCGGRALGRVADMTVALGHPDSAALIDGVLVRTARGRHLMFAWATVEYLAYDGMRVSTAGIPVSSVASSLHIDELLLHRDVLDTQIVDVIGRRVARVADILVARRRDRSLEVVAVEVGFGAVLRRLGIPPWLAGSRTDTVSWSDLHLTSARGHEVQLATPRSAVHLLDARELAALVSRLDVDSAADVLTSRGPGVAAEVVRISGPVVGDHLLRAMTDADAADVVAAMPAAHASRWRRLLVRSRLAHRRPLLRSHVWPRRRPDRG